MRKPPHNRRTDEEIQAALLAALEKEPGTRSGLETRVNSGGDIVLRSLTAMQDEGLVETYRASVQGRTYDFYCLTGRSPKPVTARFDSTWADTLAGFRKAVQEAVSAGRDPFKVAA
jgi:predicted ArsR family transcriptional regulator